MAAACVHVHRTLETAVFVVNVLAFVLMGSQARLIIERLSPEQRWGSLVFGLSVLAVVIVVRIAWLVVYRAIAATIRRWRPGLADRLASRNPGGAIGGIHPRALPDPCVNLSIHTAPDARPFPWHSCQ